MDKRGFSVLLILIGVLSLLASPKKCVTARETKQNIPSQAQEEATEIGKISRILSFGLKDRTTKVVAMLKFLMQVQGPLEILDEKEPKARAILQRYKQINDKYSKLIEKAKAFSRGKVLFFQYGGELSLSADISNIEILLVSLVYLA